MVGDGAQVVLEGATRVADIFWQVGTQATLGTGVVFEGNILAGTAVTMAGGVTLNGRALAQAQVTLDGVADVVTIPAGKGPKK